MHVHWIEGRLRGIVANIEVLAKRTGNICKLRLGYVLWFKHFFRGVTIYIILVERELLGLGMV